MKNRTLKLLAVITVLTFALTTPLCTFAKSENGKGLGQNKTVEKKEDKGKNKPPKPVNASDKQLSGVEKKLADIEKGVNAVKASIDAFTKNNPAPTTTPALANTKSDTDNLSRTVSGVTLISTADHFNNALSVMTNGIKTGENADSWTGIAKQEDYWGLAFGKNYGFNSVVYTTGNILQDGGWFASGLKVQTRQNGSWVDAAGVTVSPAYPCSSQAGTNASYTLNFSDTWGDAIRITGVPGGTATFTTIGELEVYYRNTSVSPGAGDIKTKDVKGFVNGTAGKLKALSNRLAVVDRELKSLEKKISNASLEKYKALVNKSSTVKAVISEQLKRLQGLSTAK